VGEDAELDHVVTPYGPLIKRLQAPSECEGEHEVIKYACPFAFLYYACELSSAFATFLETAIARPGLAGRNLPSSSNPDQAVPIVGPKARITLYFDEVTPGNNLRPDAGRSYLAVYWTFLEFPAWFRANQNGWFELCYIPVKVLWNIRGEHSKLTELLLAIFFPLDTMSFNFARTGMQVPIGIQPARPSAPPQANSQASPAVGLRRSRQPTRPPTRSKASPAVLPRSQQPTPPPTRSKASPAVGRWFFFLAVFACFIADEKAVKQISMAKGASGRKPCLNCQNVVGRISPEDVPADGPLVHLICGDPARFVPHTPATLQSLYSYLLGESRHRRIGVDEVAAGFVVSDDSLLASPMAAEANLPFSIYWDWMHCLVASGGVAQYELNQLLRRVAVLCPLEHLDEFSKFVKLPERHRFDASFEERVQDNDGSHIRAFASEMLSMFIIVGLFLDAVFAPLGLLEPEIKCFRLLARILYQFRRGDEVQVGLLRSLILEHHRLAVSLYPEVIRPKLHYLIHICECIERFGVLLSCFVTERKHRQSKQIGAFAYNSWCTTMLRRTVRDHLVWLQKAENLQPYKLVQPWNNALPPRWQFKLLLSGLADSKAEIQAAIKMARRLSTPRGLMCSRDLLAFRGEALPAPGGARPCQVRVGFAKMFFKVHERFFALVDDLKHSEGVTFQSGPGDTKEVFVEATDLLGAFPYMKSDEKVAIVVSTDVFA
jgi:hypothetical protein